MASKIAKNSSLPILILILTFLTRFLFLNWGQGNFFNPDENNMATAILQMTPKNLNPHFFAYGQFPLFLTFFTTLHHDFSTITLTLRFWSAIFSSLSILFFYLISQHLFKSQKISYIFALLLIFTPGLIQSAHFGTTESILIFVFSLNTFLSLKYIYHPKNKIIILASIITGIGLASKVTAIFFTIPIYLAFFLGLIKLKRISRFIFYSIIFTVLYLLFFLIFSPFNFFDFSNFKSSIIYESSVATGKLPVFYTRQFSNTTPYVFQFYKIFPYVNGIFIFIFSFVGFYFFLKSYVLNHKSKTILLVLLPSLIYLIYTGQLYVKWSRFMSPLFFLGPFFCLFLFQKIKSSLLTILLIIILISPGIYFFKDYFSPDNRILASDWTNSNISTDSSILSESGNVVNLPLDSHSTVDNFDFYQLDFNAKSLEQLTLSLTTADYIIIPSRRVFKNQNNSQYPLSQSYYQNLFSENLGFKKIIQFNGQRSLFLNSENAEETWSVFDHPTIRIYQKNFYLTPDDYQNLIK